ncbi:MAG: hypothetical protein ACOCTI_01675 [Phycisphaeraceae bacterium]
MKRSWKTWLLAGLGLILALGLPTLLLYVQGMTGAARVLGIILDVAVAGWLAFGLWAGRELPWVRRLGMLLLGTLVYLALGGLCLAMGWTGAAVAFTGAYAMAVGFVLGLMLIRLVLSPGHPVLGVARTFVDEAVRMRVALIFIILLVLVLPVLPLVMDPGDRLEYRLQTFLSWSLTLTGMLLSVMTIFVAVGTVTRELGERQIYLTLTKPVGRVQYLLGKWLGLLGLNLLLVAVCGGGIYVFTTLLARQPAVDSGDRFAVREQVLVARETRRAGPSGEAGLTEQVRERIRQHQKEDPATYGDPDLPLTRVPSDVLRRVRTQVLSDWFSLAPQQSRSFTFRGLDAARTDRQSVQLRLLPQVGRQDIPFAYLSLEVAGRPYVGPGMVQPGHVKLASDNYHVLAIPASAIGEDGTLEVVVGNDFPDGGPTVSLLSQDGLEVLFTAGSFAGNLTRGLGIIWVRLAFLAMLGLTAGSFLNFPTASVLGLLVYVASASSGFLEDSLASYAAGTREGPLAKLLLVPSAVFEALGEGEIYEAFKIVVRLLGETFMALVPSLGDYNPTPLIADGRLVPLGELFSAAIWVGLLWTGVLGVIAWLLFRKRELARVTV